MSDEQELADCRRRIAELEEQLADALSDRAVLILENESLDKLRRADAIRLARRPAPE
jgi:hypothetical protein